MGQLTISLTTPPSFANEDFVRSESNQLAYNAVMQWPHWADYGLWLYGAAGSGKSHLASMWRLLANAEPLRSFEGISESSCALLIDPVPDLSCAQTAAALFHLLNDIKQAGRHVLLVSEQPAAYTHCPLPDLHSRLKALPAACLAAPDDALLHAVWFKAFADKQLQVSPAVIDFLSAHSERSFAAIHSAVERIDCAALVHKRAVTIPFVKNLLQL